MIFKIKLTSDWKKLEIVPLRSSRIFFNFFRVNFKKPTRFRKAQWLRNMKLRLCATAGDMTREILIPMQVTPSILLILLPDNNGCETA